MYNCCFVLPISWMASMDKNPSTESGDILFSTVLLKTSLCPSLVESLLYFYAHLFAPPFIPTSHNKILQKVSEYDQEIPRSHTADQPMAP